MFGSTHDYTPPQWVEMAAKAMANAFDDKIRDLTAQVREGKVSPDVVGALALQSKVAHDLFAQLQTIADNDFPPPSGPTVRVKGPLDDH